AELRGRVVEAEKLGRGAGLVGAELASLVLNTVGKEHWSFFSIPNPAMTAGILRATNVNVTADRFRDRKMGCQMVLTLDGESVVAHRYHSHLDGYIGERTPL